MSHFKRMFIYIHIYHICVMFSILCRKLSTASSLILISYFTTWKTFSYCLHQQFSQSQSWVMFISIIRFSKILIFFSIIVGKAWLTRSRLHSSNPLILWSSHDPAPAFFNGFAQNKNIILSHRNLIAIAGSLSLYNLVQKTPHRLITHNYFSSSMQAFNTRLLYMESFIYHFYIKLHSVLKLFRHIYYNTTVSTTVQ